MKVNDIDNFVSQIHKDNELKRINNIYLSNKQINVLERYKIDYMNVIDIKELIFKIEDYIENNYEYVEMDDLENLSLELAEFNYYYNTNK